MVEYAGSLSVMYRCGVEISRGGQQLDFWGYMCDYLAASGLACGDPSGVVMIVL